jgi:hypothetical protein
MNGTDEPADEAKAEKEDGRDAHEPDDEIDDKLTRPLAHENGERRYEESEKVAHITALLKQNCGQTETECELYLRHPAESRVDMCGDSHQDHRFRFFTDRLLAG